MKAKLFFVVFLLSAVTFFLSAQADGVVLTTADVETFIKSFPSIKSDFEVLGMEYDDNHEMTLPEGFEAMEEVNKIVAKHGYADWADYYSKSSAILVTYAAIMVRDQKGEVQPELQQAIDEVKNSPYYTEEQKEQMIAAINQGMTALVEMSDSMSESVNTEVVQPFVKELGQVLDE